MASTTYDHVTKRFGGVTAVSDLTVGVTDKESHVLVRPSGLGPRGLGSSGAIYIHASCGFPAA
jgi:ABC-type branched-subunit amino acid transport system ATPase component